MASSVCVGDNQTMLIAGIDFGTVRIGVALADTEVGIATPSKTIRAAAPTADERFFRQLAGEERIDKFVVGLPVHLHGGESQKSTQAREFGAWLGTITGVPVEYFDERFTTSEADQILGAAELTKNSAKPAAINWPRKSCSRPISKRAAMATIRRVESSSSASMTKLIFGCGYLGERVAHLWHEAGDRVVVVTRSTDRAADFAARRHYQAIVADVTRPESLVELPASDTVLFAVGFDRKVQQSIHEVYAGGLRNVLSALSSKAGRVIYISTTGVYGDSAGG